MMKLRIYLENDNAITDDTYVDLAMEYGLIEEEKLKKGFTREECELVLEKLTNLYFGALWKDDYSSIACQGDIIEWNPQDILQTDADCSEIRVAEDVVDSVEAREYDYPIKYYPVYCANDDCTYYIVPECIMGLRSRFGTKYYTICSSLWWEAHEQDPIFSKTDVQEFKIAKDTYITSTGEMSKYRLETLKALGLSDYEILVLQEQNGNWYMTETFETSELSGEEIFALKEEQRKEALGRFAHTVEDCYKNHIFIDDWLDITRSDIYFIFYVIFGENGVIDTLIEDSFT